MSETKKSERQKALEEGMVQGCRAGWAAACIELARTMRETFGEPSHEVSAWIESWKDRCPEVEPLRMFEGETIEQAVERDQATKQ